MKAITCRRYGNPDVLALEDLAQPVPGDDEVLVKVHAASVNSWDWDNLRGTPPVIRLMMGLRSPKHLIPGADIAGRVDAIGNNVTTWSPGDEVFGDLSACGWGAFAEYVCVPAQALAPKPASTTFEEAAAVPQAAVMALQGIRDYGHTQPGQHVLVNGAGGGVGSLTVQLARAPTTWSTTPRKNSPPTREPTISSSTWWATSPSSIISAHSRRRGST